MRPTDSTRDRKVRITLHAMRFMLIGLLTCLAVALVSKEVGLILAGLYVPFATGIGAALGLFINGNVRVHQAQAAAQRPPGGAP
jgi:hypothetical protein